MFISSPDILDDLQSATDVYKNFELVPSWPQNVPVTLSDHITLCGYRDWVLVSGQETMVAVSETTDFSSAPVVDIDDVIHIEFPGLVVKAIYLARPRNNGEWHYIELRL